MKGELRQSEIKILRSVAGYTLYEMQHSLYSDYARAGRSGVQIPVGGNRFCPYPKTSRPGLGLNQLPIQWVPGIFPGDKAART
jgi:hypothetical protein